MGGNGLTGVRSWPWAALCLGILVTSAAQAAGAANCPGNPDAIGTSRTLVVDPKAHPRIGTMQYPETLPLEDHEVVLTFDDGPLPRNSNQILAILASQCVKATFFTVGRMAQAYPDGVRKLRDAGHTIATHSQTHPLGMDRMSIERAKQEIDDGIASVKAALGDDAALAPFFRFPGLGRAQGSEDYLASLGIQIWSADFLADDWRHISSARVYELAVKRLEANGRGILLLHDIQARTVAALPAILRDLKGRGYRIVNVVPATPELPATPTEPQQWQLHPPSETVAISRWPKIPGFTFASADALPAPLVSESEWRDGEPAPLGEPSDRGRRVAHGVPLPREAPWPRQVPTPRDSAVAALPVPEAGIFEIGEKTPTVTLAAISHPVERPVPDEQEANSAARLTPAVIAEAPHALHRTHLVRGRRPGAAHSTGRGSRLAARPHRGTLKHLVQVKKRNV